MKINEIKDLIKDWPYECKMRLERISDQARKSIFDFILHNNLDTDTFRPDYDGVAKLRLNNFKSTEEYEKAIEICMIQSNNLIAYGYCDLTGYLGPVICLECQCKDQATVIHFTCLQSIGSILLQMSEV
jgi:hypothetical protein